MLLPPGYHFSIIGTLDAWKSTSRQSGLPGLSSEAQKGTGQGLFKGGQMMNWTNPNEQNLKTNSWNLKKSFKIEKDNFIWSNNSITLGSILIFQYQNFDGFNSLLSDLLF